MRSPIKYFGGKIYMQGEIQSCYPSNLYDYTFVEGFGGGNFALRGWCKEHECKT